MYKQIEILMTVNGLNKKELSIRTDIYYQSLLDKLNGKVPFTVDEMFRVKHVLNTTLPIETLLDRAI